MAWFSRNSPRGQSHNETIAEPLAAISRNDKQKETYISSITNSRKTF